MKPDPGPPPRRQLVWSDAAYGGTASVVGDGTTDDSAAIQAAIDAVDAAGGGIVFLPDKVFLKGNRVPVKVTEVLTGDSLDMVERAKRLARS